MYKRIFFPFYGKYIERNSTTFFITPLYFVLEKQNSGVESQYSIYGILFWYFKRDYNNEHQRYGKHWRFYKLWPLFHYEYNDKGDSSFAFLSIMPFRDEEGYERLYQPFFSIVEYSRQSNGDKRFGLFLRTYFQSWNDNYFTMKIPFIISYSQKDNSLQHISLLLSFFRYTNDDVIGVELGGSLKNVIAIACGISDGLGFGTNTKAALLSGGLAEISRLGQAMRAKAKTFSGLSGLGDLVTTCISPYSRNRFVGEQIGKGKTLTQIEKHMQMVAEGIPTTKAGYRLSLRYKIDMPITKEVYYILYRNKSPLKAVKDLMTRENKEE
ncbi:MAG: NAD(P)H-dependent glycerol-3-phosphate dehydrogenase [Candidatus Omnitrophica bacterium]|nr:NAD(P)H-dependent glycerol-3-phosphate dehydrogenase [Candidatus Omnitrophota bacterium]